MNLRFVPTPFLLAVAGAASAQFIDYTGSIPPIAYYQTNQVWAKQMMDDALVKDSDNVLDRDNLKSSGGDHFSDSYTSSSDFSFSRSAAVSAQVRASIINKIVDNNPHIQRSALERDFAGDRIVRRFDQMLAKRGFSGTNLVDVLATFYLSSWEIVNDTDSDTNPRGVRAMRDRLLQSALRSAKLTSLSNEDKQKFAESLAYQVMVTASAVGEATKTGNREALQQLRGQVRSAAMELGPDPYTLKLTDQGLVPKS
jgi:hypothetical protein